MAKIIFTKESREKVENKVMFDRMALIKRIIQNSKSDIDSYKYIQGICNDSVDSEEEASKLLLINWIKDNLDKPYRELYDTIREEIQFIDYEFERDISEVAEIKTIIKGHLQGMYINSSVALDRIEKVLNKEEEEEEDE